VHTRWQDGAILLRGASTVNGIPCLAASQEVAVTDNAMQSLVRGADAALWRSLRPVLLAVKLVVKRRRREAVTAAGLRLCYFCQQMKAHNSDVHYWPGKEKLCSYVSQMFSLTYLSANCHVHPSETSELHTVGMKMKLREKRDDFVLKHLLAKSDVWKLFC